jgi:hypothetical protein
MWPLGLLFLISAIPILFKFDIKYLWDKGDINHKYQDSYPPGALGMGPKLQKCEFSRTAIDCVIM